MQDQRQAGLGRGKFWSQEQEGDSQGGRSFGRGCTWGPDKHELARVRKRHYSEESRGRTGGEFGLTREDHEFARKRNWSGEKIDRVRREYTETGGRGDARLSTMSRAVERGRARGREEVERGLRERVGELERKLERTEAENVLLKEERRMEGRLEDLERKWEDREKEWEERMGELEKKMMEREEQVVEMRERLERWEEDGRKQRRKVMQLTFWKKKMEGRVDRLEGDVVEPYLVRPKEEEFL